MGPPGAGHDSHGKAINTPQPNCLGSYYCSGKYGKGLTYARADGAFVFWYDSAICKWCLTTTVGTHANPEWRAPTYGTGTCDSSRPPYFPWIPLNDYYDPMPGTIGNPIPVMEYNYPSISSSKSSSSSSKSSSSSSKSSSKSSSTSSSLTSSSTSSSLTSSSTSSSY